jgi:hypothetical protein
MEKKADEVRFIIHWIQSLLKPNVERRDCIYCQLRQSKALETSSLMNIPGVRVDLNE